MKKNKYIFELTIASMVSLGVICAFLMFNPYRQNLDANTSSDPAVQKLYMDIDSLIASYEVYNYNFGIKICSAQNKEILFSRNENAQFVPASNLKLFPTAIALETLGADFTWKNSFYIKGDLNKETLNGDLIFKAEGDPTLSYSFLKKDPLLLFKEWAYEIKAKGIKNIKGSFIVDNSAMANSGIGKGWKDDYEQAYYATSASAFAINENFVRITVKGAKKIGNRPFISIYPAQGNIKIVNRANTSKSRKRNSISINRDNDENIIYISGSIPKNKTIGRLINLPKPGEYAANVLYEVFKKNNILFKGKLVVVENPYNLENAQIIFLHESAPLKDVLIKTNKFSNNFLANQIYLSLGYHLKQNPASSQTVIHEFLNRINIPNENLLIDDGSGLSPLNSATPGQFSDILMYMSESNNFDDFYKSFPIAGVDGTLKNVMRFHPLYKNARAKTGTINNVKSLCGYIHSADHELLSFTILVNDIKANKYKIYQFNNELLNILGNFSRNVGIYQASVPSDSLKIQ